MILESLFMNSTCGSQATYLVFACVLASCYTRLHLLFDSQAGFNPLKPFKNAPKHFLKTEGFFLYDGDMRVALTSDPAPEGETFRRSIRSLGLKLSLAESGQIGLIEKVAHFGALYGPLRRLLCFLLSTL